MEYGEEVPGPTCHLESAKCNWHYGIHRCTLRAGHDALGIPHQVVLRFDCSTAPKSEEDAIGYGLPTPAGDPLRCAYCEHGLTTGCAVWGDSPRDAGICRTFSIKR